MIFSGGTCSSKKKALTLMQGSRSIKVLCTDTVVDFVCINSTPWGEGNLRKLHALLIILNSSKHD